MAPKMLDYNATLVERVDYTPALATFKVRLDPGLEPAPPRAPEGMEAAGVAELPGLQVGHVARDPGIERRGGGVVEVDASHQGPKTTAVAPVGRKNVTVAPFPTGP